MLKLNLKYPGKAAAPNAAYPQGGSAVNVSGGGAGDGTPLEEAWVNDLYGFFEAVTAEGGVAISGNSETATASDVLTALKKLLVQNVDNPDAIQLPNTVQYQGKEVGGTARNLANMSGADLVTIGDNNNSLVLSNNGTAILSNHAGGAFDLHRMVLWAGAKITGGGVVQQSFNVASLVKNGVGDDTINLTTPATTTVNNMWGVALRTTGSVANRFFQIDPSSLSTLEILQENSGGAAADGEYIFLLFNNGA